MAEFKALADFLDELAEKTDPGNECIVTVGHEEVFRHRAGYADAGEDCLTKSAGVFVAGDCRKKSVRQLTTAAADGSVAALAACRYLDA